jgi:DNA mismatch endonuclease (patch repair protein)
VFVHGCFWHRHPGCKRASMPETRTAYWQAKFERNVARDLRSRSLLEENGWQVYVIWECELRYMTELAKELTAFLGPPRI